MKRFLFKTIALVIVFTHLFSVCFRDVAFAEQPAEPSDSKNSKKTDDSSSSQAPVSGQVSSSFETMSAAGPGFVQPMQTSAAASFNLSILQSFQSDLFTGAATFSVPINVAAGRKGLQPNLALSYSSSSPNGILGVGWNLELGSISRSVKRGVPKYNSSDIFVFNSGASQTELVNIAGNEYRAKIEGGFTRFIFDGTSWVITDKSGTRFYYGQNSSSRQEDVSRVFKWCLDKVIDVNGNYLTITYTKDQNQIYPQKIEYTANATTSQSPTNAIEFILEDRQDITLNYRAAFKVTTAKRISQIQVNANSQLQRKYVLGYNYSSSKRSLLTSVTQYSSDGLSSLPPIRFVYQSKRPALQPLTPCSGVAGSDYSYHWASIRARDGDMATFADIFDINGDGLPDRVMRPYGAPFNYWNVQLNNGSGFEPPMRWEGVNDSYGVLWASVRAEGTDSAVITNVDIFDINGDGLPDRVMRAQSPPYNYWDVQLNNGNGFEPITQWQGAVGGEYSPYWPSIRVRDGDLATYVDVIDINGDGLPDRVMRPYNSPFNYWNVQLNNGSGFEPALEWQGVTDSYSTTWAAIRAESSDSAVTTYLDIFDINGDGLPDRVRRAYSGPFDHWDIQFNSQYFPDLLQSIDNGLGASINIQYKPSTQFPNTGSDGLSDLPFPVYVTSSMIISDGLGNSYTTSYDYQDGLFDTNQREFRGFAYGKSTDSQGNTTESYFKQNDIYKGRLYKQEVRDAAGNLYSKTENTWQHTEPYTGVYFPYLAQTDSYTYDGDLSCKQTRAIFEYDAYGNPTRVVSEGDVELTGDEKTQVTEYTCNTADWLLGFPKHVYLLDANQNTVSEKWFYYDNAACFDTPATKGLLTKEEVLIYNPITQSSDKATTQYAYDEYGNLISITDALNHTTTTEYDTLFYTYPVTITNALGHTVETVYYGINESVGDPITGSGLLGQVKYFQDPNNQRTYNIYDALGRLIKVIGPNDTPDYPGVIYEYYLTDKTNLLTNGSFESWSAGADAAPDGWIAQDAAVAQESIIKKQSNYSVMVTPFGAAHYLYQSLPWDDSLRGKTFTFGCWVYGTANRARLGIYDGIATSWSDYINTSDSWQFLSVTRTISNSATELRLQLIPDDYTNNSSAYFDGALLIEGEELAFKLVKKVKSNTSQPFNYLTAYQFYNGLGQLIQSKSPAEADPQTGVPRQIISDIARFDSRGQVKEKYLPYFVNESADYVSPDYNTAHSIFDYDPLGRLIQATNPDATYSTINYSDWVTTAIDENGHYKTSYYDAYGRITKIEEHNATQTYTTVYEYDTLGNLIKLIDNQGNTTQLWFDSLARKIKMNDPDMGVWTYEYDLVGNLIKQTDAKAQVLEFNYDSLNRLTRKLANSQTLVTYIYDDTVKGNCIGRLSKITDLSGSTEFFYDNLGREVKSTKTVNGSGSFTVEREYDALDRLVTLKYPDGEIVTYEYNPQGIEKVYTIRYPLNAIRYIDNIDYSPSGQIIKIQYGNGTETNYTYDPQTLRLNQLLTHNSQLQTIQNLNYQFNNVGNIKNLTDYVNSATQSFLYDDLDRLVQASGSYGTFTYDYDSIGNMLYKEGATLSYGEGSVGPHAVTSYTLNANRYTLNYDNNGNLIKKQDLEFTYDAENRLTKVEETSTSEPKTLSISLTAGWNFFSLPVIPADTSISSVLSSISGRYEQVSRYNATTETFEHYAGNPQYDQFESFEYARGYQIYITDPQGAVLSVTGTLPQEASIQLKSGYNLIFSPKTEETDVEEALKPLKIGVDYSKVTHYNKTTLLFENYDSSTQGFTTLKPGESYYIFCLKDTTWTIENGQPTTTFVYDGDGGRVRKQITDDRGQIIASTTYIGSLYEVDSTGKTTKHIFAGSNRICSIETDNQQLTTENYYHSDHLGSSNVITDENGNQVGLTEFTPYGSTFKQEGTYEPKHKFTGKELDSTTGLYFYGARYYDPTIGRFITADTIVQAPYDPQSLNRYAYARDNPIRYVDPNGRWFWVALIVGAILGGASAAANDQPIWKGVLMGAASGALIGAGAAGFGFWGAVAGGMFAGAGSAAVSGGNIGFGALAGGLGAGLGYGLGSWASGWNSGSFWGELGGAAFAGAMAGGVGAELQGGSFGRGAGMGAAYGSAGFFGSKVGNSLDPRTRQAQARQREARARHALNSKKNDMIKIPVGSRDVSFFKLAGHEFLPNWEMGPGPGGKIFTTNTVKDLSGWATNIETQSGAARGYTTVEVSASGLVDAIQWYEQNWVNTNTKYSPISFNSNYAVNTVIYAAGGSVPGGLGWNPPGGLVPSSVFYPYVHRED